MRVLIAEDQTAIRQMLATFIGAMPGFEIAGEAGSVADALEVAERTKPQLVILDWMLLGGFGLDFLRSTRIDPPPKVLVFSANTTELAVREALAAGARGYIEKTASFGEFTTALHSIASGETYLGPEIRKNVVRLATKQDQVPVGTELTPREREVIALLAEGKTSKEIGQELSLSVRTVENHRARIMRRTGVRSTAKLAMLAVRLGLIAAPPSDGDVDKRAR